MSHDRWEYKVIHAPTSIWGTAKPAQLTEALNKEGQQGWELVNVLMHGMQLHFFLKRPR